MCLDPEKNTCEHYMQAGEHCWDEAGTWCIHWQNILIAIALASVSQVIFEASMLCSLEISLKPSAFDKLQNSELENDEADA